MTYQSRPTHKSAILLINFLRRRFVVPATNVQACRIMVAAIAEVRMSLLNYFDPIERGIRRRGGRIDASTLKSLFVPLEETLGLAAESASFFLRKPRTVTCALVNDMPFNAAATVVSRNRYLVTVNRGMVIRLLAVFSRLGDNPNFLPAIADRPLPTTMSDDLKAQIAYRKSKAVELFNVFALVNSQARPGKPRLVQIPFDPVRMLLVLSMVQFAIEFASFHETSHITEGHLDFLSRADQNKELDESYESKGKPWAPYLEADADAYAVHKVLAVLMGLVSEHDFNSTMRPLPGGVPFTEPSMVYETWLNSIGAFILVLASVSPLPKASGIGSHHFGLYRFIIISKYLENIWPALGLASTPPIRALELYLKLSIQLTQAGLDLEGVNAKLIEFLANGDFDRFKIRLSAAALEDKEELQKVKEEITDYSEQLPREARARLSAMEEIFTKLTRPRNQ